jgi:hypothetical protein
VLGDFVITRIWNIGKCRLNHLTNCHDAPSAWLVMDFIILYL